MNQVVLFGDTVHLSPRPSGIYVIASHLRSKGYPTQTVWGWCNIAEEEFQLLCKKFITAETKIVGISTTLMRSASKDNLFFGITPEMFEQRIAFIKSINPDIKIVLGGSQIRYTAEKNIPKLELIDYLVKGQGESTLVWILENFDKPVINKLISDEEIPFDEFSDSIVEFNEQDCVQPNESMFFEFARGCIFKCSYCSYHIKGKKRNEFSKRMDCLKQELIQNYEKHGMQYYYVTDDLINDSEEKVEEIYNLSQQLPFKLQYSGYTRLDLFWRFPETAKMLKESGLISTYFGLETLNDQSGKAVGKGLGIDRINEGMETCRQAWGDDVHLTCSFILGLPHDTPETKYELMEWLNRADNKQFIKLINLLPLHISEEFGFTDMSLNPGKYGYFRKTKNNTPSPIWMRGVAVPSMDWHTKTYSFAEATQDAQLVLDDFYKDYKYTSLRTFNIPLFMSLTNHKKEMWDVIMHDKSDVWQSDKEWKEYLVTLYDKNKKEYMKQMFSI